ncbi:hypothetical protein G5S34_17525 [Herbaspirillum frisingense]|uniref:hypothetical protein n=1 Tax=Herbaspirillum frisingense TaxID=92645 RepID=UPI0016012022|nr:hypothetical protein [Herbaspirillum frisingense]QNB08374.1 hypothetical protein G5S34_17525 [Herbaspirillum frisingense]
MSTTPTQPQIDPALIFLRGRVAHCNHFIDLYGTYDSLAKQFKVVQAALAGTLTDISDFFTRSDFVAWDALVNEDGAGEDEALQRLAEAKEMQRDEHEFAGVGA